MKCSMCGRALKENELFFGELGTEFENKPLCKKCYFKNLNKLFYTLKYTYNHKKDKEKKCYRIKERYEVPEYHI